METKNLVNQVNEIFCDILDNNLIVLEPSLTANDVEGWDSLTHIQLIVAIEKHFRIRFSSREIQNWSTVGDMLDCIDSKLKLSLS